MNSTIRTSRNSLARRLALMVAVTGFGLAGLVASPAGAVPDGPGDLTTCVDLDDQGQPNCPSIPDPIDDFTAGDPVDPPDDTPDDTPDGGGASVDGSDALPPAPVGDVVVANPTFTG